MILQIAPKNIDVIISTSYVYIQGDLKRVHRRAQRPVGATKKTTVKSDASGEIREVKVRFTQDDGKPRRQDKVSSHSSDDDRKYRVWT